MQEIKNCYHQMYQAMINKNTNDLNELLDDSFVLVHMTGMIQPKEEFLQAIKNGVLNYFSEKEENVHVSVVGEKASLVGQSLVNAAVFGGGRHTWRLQLDLSLIQKGNHWVITKVEASTY